MSVRRLLAGNRHHAALAAGLLALAALSPAPRILSAFAGPPAVEAPAVTGTTIGTVPLPTTAPSAPPVVPASAPPPVGDAPVAPPADEADPVVACGSDEAASLLASALAPLGALLGAPTFGSSLPDLARLASGCGDVDPTAALLALVVDVSRAVPDLGLPRDVLPDLPALDLSFVPPEVIAALAPLGDGVRQACAQMPTLTVLLAVIVPALQLPVSQSDVLNLLGPTVALCGLFPPAAQP